MGGRVSAIGWILLGYAAGFIAGYAVVVLGETWSGERIGTRMRGRDARLNPLTDDWPAIDMDAVHAAAREGTQLLAAERAWEDDDERTPWTQS